MESLKIYDIDAAALARDKYAVIKTEKGDMKLELFGDEAPQAVTNFANLARSGFYKRHGHGGPGLAHKVRMRPPKAQARARRAIDGARGA